MLVRARDDLRARLGLVHALGDELVLERLVEERDRERDEVRERDEELEPEEDGESADELSRADERSNETVVFERVSELK